MAEDRKDSADEGLATEIPNPETGVGVGADDEANTFEPEEDPE